MQNFDVVTCEIDALSCRDRVGKVRAIAAGSIVVDGLSSVVRIGDLIEVSDRWASPVLAEVVAINDTSATLTPFDPSLPVKVGATARMAENIDLKPNRKWIGRIVDAFGRPLDGRPISQGPTSVPLWAKPPPAKERRSLGSRLRTGFAVFDTVLPIARGQRLGVFAGSGVGKTTLLAGIARQIEADCIVICLVGERGRELNEFIARALGEQGLNRSVVVTATSDQSALMKRRAVLTATSIAEYFRDQGLHVLLILDSVTRFAEAHREVALMGGETPSLRAFPPSTSGMIAALTERAGTGCMDQGDITAIYSVLVAGSDMEEPIADMTRGLLDGHLVLDREIAERGRFPAIDVRRSVSRSLPDVADAAENALIASVRQILSSYESAEPMIQTGLYVEGSDPRVDLAVKLWPLLDEFFQANGLSSTEESFALLRQILEEIDSEDRQ